MIGGILLAAGESRRFGSDKRNAILDSGETVLVRSVAVMREVVDKLMLVIGKGDAEPEYRRRFPDLRVYRATGSVGGMGCTLAEAIAAVDDWNACLVSLADKPFITASTMRSVREQLENHAIVVPVFKGETGHPVGFARAEFPALAQLRGDRGARGVLERAGQACHYLAVDDAGVIADIDTPADLIRWSRVFGLRCV